MLQIQIGVENTVPTGHLASTTGGSPYKYELSQAQLQLNYKKFAKRFSAGVGLGKLYIASSQDVMVDFILPCMRSKEDYKVTAGNLPIPLEFADQTSTGLDLTYFIIRNAGDLEHEFSVVIPVKAGCAISTYGADIGSRVLEVSCKSLSDFLLEILGLHGLVIG